MPRRLGGKFKVGDRVLPSSSSKKIMMITSFDRVEYRGRMTTFVDGIDHLGQKMRRPLASIVHIKGKKDG